ncbi:hypothetical protein An12g08980 [Aspergillus niger]|uniref:Uncharacterized protein n=2 Tax=Aspergillus niger TaxID=5061 RepID=A2R0L1_ASPNC|nr:hypothetical protein An12g08980 [Aspergillus niger]CAK46385.1 hypothetical protein An12g08980 [Aspergillus niger]
MNRMEPKDWHAMGQRGIDGWEEGYGGVNEWHRKPNSRGGSRSSLARIPGTFRIHQIQQQEQQQQTLLLRGAGHDCDKPATVGPYGRLAGADWWGNSGQFLAPNQDPDQSAASIFLVAFLCWMDSLLVMMRMSRVLGGKQKTACACVVVKISTRPACQLKDVTSRQVDQQTHHHSETDDQGGESSLESKYERKKHEWVNLNGRRYCSFSASRNAKNPSRPAPLATPAVTGGKGGAMSWRRLEVIMGIGRSSRIVTGSWVTETPTHPWMEATASTGIWLLE